MTEVSGSTGAQGWTRSFPHFEKSNLVETVRIVEFRLLPSLCLGGGLWIELHDESGLGTRTGRSSGSLFVWTLIKEATLCRRRHASQSVVSPPAIYCVSSHRPKDAPCG